MPTYSQDNRIFALSTPAGKDALLLESFQGTEGVSRLFSFELTMLSEKPAITFEDIVGKNVTVSVILPSGAKRFFNGIVSRFVQGTAGGSTGVDPRFSRYRATVVPWLWLLTRSADSRIFQNMSVPEIVEQLFRDRGFADFSNMTEGSYEKRDFCVQYRETDFNFVSRLLEEEGIHYFFEHGNGKHTLILADTPSANKPCPNQQIARYQMNIGGRHEEDKISALEKMQEIRPTKYTLSDYNFVTPNTSLKAESPTKYKLGPGEREVYDYPGMYGTKSEGERYAGIRMEEEETQITTIAGGSTCRAFISGYRFTLESFCRKDMNSKEYLLTSIQHQIHQGWGNDAPPEYENRFTCIPADIPFRPARLTPKPVVQGVQTAVVVGKPGEEIYVDEHGRVKVQFHWDRTGTKDEKSSCWIRVSQLWAGAGWGALFIPRIGQEVIVDFLEGDPDRPIITGRVYHGINKPPYPLPGEMTKSTIKSNSTKDGDGFNELRFEDKKENEQIYLHAEKDWEILVKNDTTENVEHDRKLTVKNDQTDHVQKNKLVTVDENLTEKVGKDHQVTITGNRTTQVDGDAKNTITGNLNTEVSTGNYQVRVGVGNFTCKADAGQITLEAMQKIELKVGGNSITIDLSGITIKGAMVSIEGQAMTQVKSPMTQVSGDGMLTLKGGIVMIN